MHTNNTNIVSDLVEVGKQLAQMGMVPATSGNFSARLSDGGFAITQSGVHKGKMAKSHIMTVDGTGQSYDERQPSAETQLHIQIYNRYPEVKVVLHVHSLHATILSQLEPEAVKLTGYELLKALPGINTHETEVAIPVFDNDQDIPRLADKVDTFMAVNEQIPAYLISGHGIYSWGESIQQALMSIEALEFLFACELKKRRV